MEQKDKDLLLRDLCARLPYGVKCDKGEPRKIISIKSNGWVEIENGEYIPKVYPIEDIKPYLFPLSSMTEEQRKELILYACYEARNEDCGRHCEIYYYDMVGHENVMFPDSDGIDWLNAHHFDYRNLIEKKLAIDCTNLNIY